MTMIMNASPPAPRAPIAIRTFQPSYASWNTSTTASDEERKPPMRYAVCAQDISATSLLKHLHKLTGHKEPVSGEIKAVETGSVVKVLGWRQVEQKGDSHLVYTILAASRPRKDASDTSEARLVQRRYRDFAKLYAALTPISRDAGLALPSLPSKLTFGRSPAAIGAQRKEALHEWLGWVVSQPELLCDELRRFLGLSPLASCDTSDSTRSIGSDMEVDESLPRESPMSSASTARTCDTISSSDELPEVQDLSAYTVDLAELEMKAVEVMLDDELWGRR